MTNKKIFWVLIVLVLVGTLPVLGLQKGGDRVGYHDTILVSAGETRDNVVTFGGDIIIEGTVRKTVFALGGTITVSGEVGESVVGIGSRITIKSTAVIKRDLVGIAGTIEKEPGFRVDGDTVFVKGGGISDKFINDGLKGLLTFSFWPIIIIIKMVGVFLWALVAFIAAMILPRQIALAGGEVRKAFWPIFGTGLLALVCYTILAIISAILCLLLIGIPILFSLVVAGLVIKIFGKVALFYFFGESLARGMRSSKVSVLGVVMLGLLLVSLVGFIPIIGSLFSLVLSIVGWGVAIRTKFGTTDNWFRHRTVPAFPAGPVSPPPAPPTA